MWFFGHFAEYSTENNQPGQISPENFCTQIEQNLVNLLILLNRSQRNPLGENPFTSVLRWMENRRYDEMWGCWWLSNCKSGKQLTEATNFECDLYQKTALQTKLFLLSACLMYTCAFLPVIYALTFPSVMPCSHQWAASPAKATLLATNICTLQSAVHQCSPIWHSQNL